MEKKIKNNDKNSKTMKIKVLSKGKAKKIDVDKITLDSKVSDKTIIPNRLDSTFKLFDLLIIVVITLVVSFAMGVTITLSLTSKDKQKISDENIKEFVKQYEYIADNYYETVDKDKLIDGAIKGMVDSLDDNHAAFIDPDNSSLDQTLQGSYEGVGIEVYNSPEKNVVVLRVFDKSPAKEAGIVPGDIIISIDGKNMEGKTTTEFADHIRKNNGKKNFVVQYKRDGKTKTVMLQKKYVIIQSVTSKIYEQNDKKVGYLYVSTFSATTYNQFKRELENLEKQNIDSLIIDLRNNTGGHLNVVADMLSLLADKTHVLYQIQNKDKTTKFYSTGSTTKKYPVVVLQNSSSASASELMSSALQEQLKATVVGTSSYGKGTVQELINLSDGNQYKFTTKKWLTSNGKWINEVGVVPNLKVELNDNFYSTGDEKDDNQLQEAIKMASK